MTGKGPEHIAVIGAGIVGASVAQTLLDAGLRVTLVDPAPPGGAQAASFGNGAFISPASIIPMSMPGLWRNLPGYLTDPLGPLTIRWRSLPGLSEWLVRFLLAGATEARVTRTAGLLAGLLHDGPDCHAALAARIGQPGFIRRTGLIYAYRDRAAFAAEALAWRLRRANGLQWRELEGAALRSHEPALGPQYGFAAVVDAGAQCTDPGAYVAAMVADAEARGAARVQARVTGIDHAGGRIAGLRTDQGPIPCDGAVVAAGYRSAALARQVGDRIPLVSERGYHVELRGATGGPANPVLPSDGKMANTPLDQRLRASGQVELASAETPPDWRRADILLRNLERTYPGLSYDPAAVSRWMGHRPSTPDGLPVIGLASGCAQVVHAFGHGHIGLAAAPKTAAIVAALVTGAPPPVAVAAFAPGRFRRGGWRRAAVSRG